MHLKRISWLTLWILLSLLGAACRQAQVVIEPTSVPTFTPTPRSTPLPAIATPIPAGQTDNPIQMVLRPEGDRQTAEDAVSDFEAAMLDKTGLVIEVALVDQRSEVLAAICDAAGRPSIVWLDGLGYLAARAQECGEPVLQVQRGSEDALENGRAAAIIVQKDGEISSLAELSGKTFCRLSAEDGSSWILPSLFMRTEGIDPFGLEAVTDYSDIPRLVRAVVRGDCDAAGIPADALELFADDLGDNAEEVSILETTLELPFALLLMPTTIPLATQQNLSSALVDMAAVSETALTLRAFLGQQALTPVNADDFLDLGKFIADTGLDFTQLGN
jgi:ABC-type phosphate/phosphonate transport system substrate-binding protein